MILKFNGIEIECEQSELQSALDAIRTLATLTPSATPSATRAPSATPSNAESALRALLKAKGASGMKYTSALRDAGISLESALAKRCRDAGCDESEIASALALVGNEEPSATLADSGETITEEGVF